MKLRVTVTLCVSVLAFVAVGVPNSAASHGKSTSCTDSRSESSAERTFCNSLHALAAHQSYGVLTPRMKRALSSCMFAYDGAYFRVTEEPPDVVWIDSFTLVKSTNSQSVFRASWHISWYSNKGFSETMQDRPVTYSIVNGRVYVGAGSSRC